MAKKSEIGTAEELADLCITKRSVTVGDHEIIVRELNILEIGGLFETIEPLIAAYELDVSPTQLIARHTRAVVDLTAAATDRTAKWLGGIGAGGFLRVATAAIEVNGNFFEVVADLVMGQTGERIGKIFAGAGLTPSSSSASTVSTQ